MEVHMHAVLPGNCLAVMNEIYLRTDENQRIYNVIFNNIACCFKWLLVVEGRIPLP